MTMPTVDVRCRLLIETPNSASMEHPYVFLQQLALCTCTFRGDEQAAKARVPPRRRPLSLRMKALYMY